MSDNTYSNVVKELIKNHYLVQNKGNLYDFYTVPHSNGVCYPTTMGDNTPLECGSIPHSNGREISNKSNKNNLSNKNKNADAKKEISKKKDRDVDDLTLEEKAEIFEHYKKRDMNYAEMYKHYNLEFG